MKPRSIVYVDGFNLYYGALKGTSWKWLDIQSYFDRVRNEDDVSRIYYFTALVDGPRRSNQETYFRALRTLERVSIVLGKYKRREVRCSVRNWPFHGRSSFSGFRGEAHRCEHRPANAHRCLEDNCDKLIVVSGDSDLVPAIRAVKRVDRKKQTIVYVPHRTPQRGAAKELRDAADRNSSLPLKLIERSQLPKAVRERGKKLIATKPQDW